MKAFCFYFGFIVTTTTTVLAANHPCERECKWPAEPQTCKYDFTVEWYSTMSKACFDCPKTTSNCTMKDCIAADGVERSILTVNRQMPGPIIRVCFGDTIEVKVKNHMENGEGLSIHWHGLYVKGKSYMDGVGMLTQCPIPVHSSFTYKILAEPPGTHWWHSHSGMQRADGLAGAIIIDRSQQTNPHANNYDIDSSEHVAIMSDWVHTTYLDKFIAHHHSVGSNKAESFLINGKGYFKTNETEASNLRTPLEVFTVEPGKRHRFRIINNAVLFCPNEITVDGHTLTIISSDGVDVEPYDVTTLVMHGGERFDFVLNANQAVGNYWLTAQGLADCINQTGKAIVRYTGAADEEPTTTKLRATDPSYKLINPLNQKQNLQNRTVVDLNIVYSEHYKRQQRLENPTADEVHFLGWDFNKINNPKFNDPDFYPITEAKALYTPSVNNVSWVFPESPLLTQPNDIPSDVLCNPDSASFDKTKYCSKGYCECPYVIDVELDKLVELVLYDEGFTFNAGHPFHMHGYHFAVVAMDRLGKQLSTEDVKAMHSNGSMEYKLKNAPMKDTVIVPDGGYTVVRFIADNPGVWFFHCHLEFHQSIGMGLVFRVGYPYHIPKAPKGFPKCGSLNWEESGAGMKQRQTLWLTLFALVASIKLANM